MKIIELIKEWLVANIDKILHLAVSYMIASLFGIWIAAIAGIAIYCLGVIIK